MYLTPLNRHRDPKVIRETLSAYFKAGHNASAAGSALGIDRRTIHQRLRWIEGVLGVQIPDVSAELDIALRLERLLAQSSSAKAKL